MKELYRKFWDLIDDIYFTDPQSSMNVSWNVKNLVLSEIETIVEEQTIQPIKITEKDLNGKNN